MTTRSLAMTRRGRAVAFLALACWAAWGGAHAAQALTIEEAKMGADAEMQCESEEVESSDDVDDSHGGFSAARAWRLRIRPEVHGRMRAKRWEFAGRYADGRPLGYADIGFGGQGRSRAASRVRVIAGEMEVTWAAGGLLAQRSLFGAFPVPRASRGKATLFGARGTLAKREERCWGMAAQLLFGDGDDEIEEDDKGGLFGWASRTRWASGTREEESRCFAVGAVYRHAGLMLIGGPSRDPQWSAAVRWHAREQDGSAAFQRHASEDDGSAAHGTPDGGSLSLFAPVLREGCVILEATGGLPIGTNEGGEPGEGDRQRRTVHALAGYARQPLMRLFGAVEAAWMWSDETSVASAADAEADSGWRIDWQLPLLRGVRPIVGLRMTRPVSGGALRPMERVQRLALETEPWSGAELRVTFGATEKEQCRADPDDAGTRALLRAHRSLLEVEGRMRVTEAITLAVRFRDSRASLAYDEADAPIGLPGRRQPLETVEDDESARSWDRGGGSVLHIEAAQRGQRFWSGASLAAVPEEASSPAYVPLHAARSGLKWRAIPAGCLMGEAWAGVARARTRFEGVVRLMRLIDGGLEAAVGVSAAWTCAGN